MTRPRVSAFLAISLDGFIARPDGGLDWLDIPPPTPDEDYGYAAFFESVDGLVMGRHSFETVRGFDAWPYGDTPVEVLTHRPLDVPPALAGKVHVSADTPAELVARLGAAGRQHLYVDGGRTVQGFLAAGLLDALTLTRIPVILGAGIPLFGPLAASIPLHHDATRVFANGLVQSRYLRAQA